MLQKSVIIIIFYIFICNKFSVPLKYCIVDSNNNGIFINSTLGRLRTYPVSTTLYTKLLNNFTNNNLNNWQIILSVNNDEINYKLGPILDQRWEDLQPVIDYHELIPGYWSIKIYDGKLHKTFNGCKQNEWCHIYINNTGNNLITFYGPHDIIKVHNYYFAYTKLSGETLIYESHDDGNNGNGCIFLFTAMCNSCQMTIKIINRYNETIQLANVVNYNAKTNWQRNQLCSPEIPENYRIIIVTENYSNDDDSSQFWAIDDLYYSPCKNDKRFMEVRCEMGFECNCEDVHNRNYELFDNLPDDCKKIETTTTITMTTTTTTITTTIEEIITETTTENTSLDDILFQIESTTEQFNQINELDNEKNEQNQANLYFLFILILPFILVAIIFFVYKYKRRTITNKTENHKTSDYHEMNLIDKMVTTIQCNDFENYLKDAFDANNQTVDLFKQFQSLPEGYCRSHIIGSLVENSNKNKSTDNVPYDDNRVILTKVLPNGETRYDYINASFIDGINSNEYIAAQDPLKTTIEDFWYMIWQENVEFIVANTTKHQHYLQYWPNSNKTTIVNNITIDFVKVTEFEYFLRREFIVTKDGVCRNIFQYHFPYWSISNDQVYSHTLVPFIKELLSITSRNHPILVHSSLGIGRAAFIILCDIILRSSQINNRIDIYETTKNLRRYRINMINDMHLYKLAHLVILECQYDMETTINVQGANVNTNKALLKNNYFINKQWKYLEERRWIDELSVEPQISNFLLNKNRYEDILPLKHSRVVLKHITPDYINATRVDGYQKPDKFIVTQQPLKQTLADFWIMILQNNVTAIVNLNVINFNDNISCLFWPTDENRKLKPMPDIIIEYQSKTDYMYFEKYTIAIEDQGKKRKDIVVINMKNWLKTMDTPESTDSLLNIRQIVKELPKTITVVISDDGIIATGLLVGLIYILDKIDDQKHCDVVGAVRMLRRSHHKFINYKQFVFLYKCVENYLNKI